MNDRQVIPSLAYQLSLACNLFAVSHIISLSSGDVGRLFPFVLIPYALLIYLADLLFLRRERSMAALAVLNISSAVILLASIYLVDGFFHWTAVMFIVIFCGWPAASAAQLALQPPKIYSLILCFDVSAVLLIFFTAYVSVSGLPTQWTLPIALGCVAAFLGIVCLRSGRAPGLKDSLMLLGAFAGLSALLWLIMNFAAPAGHGIVSLVTALVAAATFLLENFWRFLNFLISLLPDAEYEEMPMEPQIPAFDMEELAQESTSPVGMVLFIVLLLGLLCAGIWLLLQLRSVKLGGKSKRRGAPAPKRERVSLLRALRLLLRKLNGKVKTAIFLRKRRNHPDGLFCLLVRRCRLAPWRKRAGETPREFLLRLKNSSGNDPELALALEELALAVEKSFYAPADAAPPFPKAALIRRRVGAAAARQHRADMKAALAEKLFSKKGQTSA